MNLTTSSIILRGVRLYAYHGVLPQERAVGANFLIDLTLHADLSGAVAHDDLSQTINYAAVYDLVKEEMAIPSSLLEHAGGRIAQRLLDTFAALTTVTLRITKENPPMGADCQAVGVELTLAR